jgi:hypothetical protein
MENANRQLEEFVKDLVTNINIGLNKYSYIGGKNKNNVINPLPITPLADNICKIYMEKNNALAKSTNIPLDQIGIYVIYKPNTNTQTAKYVISLNNYCNNKYNIPTFIKTNKNNQNIPNNFILLDDKVSLNRNSLKRSNEGSRRESKVINNSIKFLYVIGLNLPIDSTTGPQKQLQAVSVQAQTGPNYTPEERGYVSSTGRSA